MLGFRPLQSYLTIIIGTVLQVDVKTSGMLLHPSPILIYIGSIDNEEEIILAHLIYQKVIYCSTILIAHHAVVYLTHRCIGYIIGEDMLHITLGIRSFHRNLAHVTHIEEACMFTYSQMLWCDTRILIQQRHIKPTKRHHCSTLCHVSIIKTGTFISPHWFCFNSHSK